LGNKPQQSGFFLSLANQKLPWLSRCIDVHYSIHKRLAIKMSAKYIYCIYVRRGADKSLAQPGRKKSTPTKLGISTLSP
jgi:hypothetical protein